MLANTEPYVGVDSQSVGSKATPLQSKQSLCKTHILITESVKCMPATGDWTCLPSLVAVHLCFILSL